MAFVFRSPRITNLSQVESNIEPFPKETNNNSISVLNSTSSLLSSKNNSNKIKAPFGAFSKKKTLNDINKEDIPGPGSYELSSSLIKNKFNKNETSPDDKGSPSEKSKRLFISKKERLDKAQYETDVPGPGKYFLDRNKRKFNNYNTVNKKSNWIKPEKTVNYSPFSTSRILSIPSKGMDFGYELNKKGELILSPDPAKDIKFQGTKNNSVGPGQYYSDTYDKKNTKIGIIDWNKSISSTKGKKKKDDKKNNIINLSQYDSSNYFFSSNSTDPTTNNSLSIVNYNKKNRTKNYFYNGLDLDRNNFEIKFSNNKIYKNDNFAKTINRSNLSPFFKPDINTKNEFYIGSQTEFRESDDYDNYFTLNSFVPKTVSENQQFFGSTLSRGIMFPKNRPNNNIKYGRNEFKPKEKIDVIPNSLHLSNSANSNINSDLESIHQKKKKKLIIKKIDKAEFIKEISKSLKKDYSSNHGPGSYDPKSIPKYNFSNETGNFGSLERRFPIYKKDNQEGGILSYLYLEKWGPKKTTNYLRKVIPQNVINKLKDGISMNKVKMFREKIMQQTRTQPPLGTYDVEKINTIESRVKNAVNAGKNLPAFNTSTKRVLIEGQMKQDFGLGIEGMDQEIKNEKIKDDNKTIKKNFAPFLSNTRRDDMENFEKERISNIGGKIGGPGYYKIDSYFDWNKKSYNILFN